MTCNLIPTGSFNYGYIDGTAPGGGAARDLNTGTGGGAARGTNQSPDVGPTSPIMTTSMPSTDDLTAQYQGIALALARLLRPLWCQPLVVLRQQPDKQAAQVAMYTLTYICCEEMCTET